MRRSVLPLIAVPFLALVLSACGSDSTAGAPAAATSTTTVASSSPTTTARPTTTVPTSSAATTSTGSASPATGATMTALTGKALPASVGAWTQRTGGTAQLTFFDMGGSSVTAVFLAGSDYAGISTNVTQMATEASTGVCGSTGTSMLCYLRAADGVVNLNGEDDMPVADLVAFADAFATAVGTS